MIFLQTLLLLAIIKRRVKVKVKISADLLVIYHLIMDNIQMVKNIRTIHLLINYDGQSRDEALEILREAHRLSTRNNTGLLWLLSTMLAVLTLFLSLESSFRS